jgi:mono/diheme cytochrome c family protein
MSVPAARIRYYSATARIGGIMNMTPPSLFAIGLTLVLPACQPAQAPQAQARGAVAVPLSDAQLIERGDYLVRIAGCNDCHTPGYMDRQGNVDRSQWLVGNTLGFSGPWGTTYPKNLRLSAADKDEAQWLAFTADLHTRPMMPDFAVRAMSEEDRRALYRLIKSLGATGQPAPAYLPPGQEPPPPYVELVLPPPPPGAAPAQSTPAQTSTTPAEPGPADRG